MSADFNTSVKLKATKEDMINDTTATEVDIIVSINITKLYRLLDFSSFSKATFCSLNNLFCSPV